MYSLIPFIVEEEEAAFFLHISCCRRRDSGAIADSLSLRVLIDRHSYSSAMLVVQALHSNESQLFLRKLHPFLR